MDSILFNIEDTNIFIYFLIWILKLKVYFWFLSDFQTFGLRQLGFLNTGSCPTVKIQMPHVWIIPFLRATLLGATFEECFTLLQGLTVRLRDRMIWLPPRQSSPCPWAPSRVARTSMPGQGWLSTPGGPTCGEPVSLLVGSGSSWLRGCWRRHRTTSWPASGGPWRWLATCAARAVRGWGTGAIQAITSGAHGQEFKVAFWNFKFQIRHLKFEIS